MIRTNIIDLVCRCRPEIERGVIEAEVDQFLIEMDRVRKLPLPADADRARWHDIMGLR